MNFLLISYLILIFLVILILFSYHVIYYYDITITHNMYHNINSYQHYILIQVLHCLMFMMILTSYIDTLFNLLYNF